MLFPHSAFVRAFLPGLVLAFSPLGVNFGHAAVLIQTVNVSVGTVNLNQFNPALGTLNSVTFSLTSALSGTALVTGTPNNGSCDPNFNTINFGITGFNSNLNLNSSTVAVGTGPAPSCVGSVPFGQAAVNLGPTAGTGILADYIGGGLMPFTFSVIGATTSSWTGTLEVDFNYTAAAPTPEPSTAMLALTAIASLVALKRRR